MSIKVHYDETSLVRSRRVPQNTCELISNKLGIDIQSSSLENNAIIYLENSSEIHAIITDESIPKLVWNKKVKNALGCNYINWSYSKGDTYSKSCIILTSSTNNIEDWINISSTKTRNALYVALTRSKGDIYIIRSDNYNKWCSFVENNK